MALVKIFTLAELGINHAEYLNKLKKHYAYYEYDEYLYRQTIIKRCAENKLVDFYENSKEIESFYLHGGDDFFDHVKVSKHEFDDIKKYRKRMVCSISVNRDGNFKREMNKNFNQNKAKVVDGAFDFRLYPRVFKEAPNELIGNNTLKIVKNFSDIIFDKNRDSKKIRVVIHYTIIESIVGAHASNSPEGVHQDGMDYIISALVMEKSNISGGISNIYYPRCENKILEVQLKEGMGIFQSDINTNLWHEVTNIVLKDEKCNGFRSTIGFDFEVIR